MGRKIPAKKHHGVKDPAKQAEQRFAKIKSKINEVPLNIDDQEVPKKVKMLFKSKQRQKKKHVNDDVKPAKIDPKLKNQKIKTPQRPVKKVPTFERMPGETDRNLLWRAELTTRTFLNKSKFEDKYDVDLETNQETGDVKVKKRDWSYLDDGKKEEPANKWEKKKMKKLAKKEQEKQEKLKLKKDKLKEKKLYKKNKSKMDDFSSIKQDKVEFGEVAEQPPQLSAKPRKSSHLERPGYRDLLLKTMLPSTKNSSKTVDLSGKRKDLPVLDRQRLEDERERVVELYRAQQKLKHSNPA